MSRHSLRYTGPKKGLQSSLFPFEPYSCPKAYLLEYTAVMLWAPLGPQGLPKTEGVLILEPPNNMPRHAVKVWYLNTFPYSVSIVMSNPSVSQSRQFHVDIRREPTSTLSGSILLVPVGNELVVLSPLNCQPVDGTSPGVN